MDLAKRWSMIETLFTRQVTGRISCLRQSSYRNDINVQGENIPWYFLSVDTLFFFFFKSTIYHMGCIGKPWQIHYIYLN